MQITLDPGEASGRPASNQVAIDLTGISGGGQLGTNRISWWSQTTRRIGNEARRVLDNLTGREGETMTAIIYALAALTGLALLLSLFRRR